MAKVTEILSKMTFIDIRDTDGNIHAIPLRVFQKIGTGEMPVTALDDWEKIIPIIIQDWIIHAVLGDGKAI